MNVPHHLLITGPPGCGKTTLIRRLAESLTDLRPAGFFTAEIRERGERRGFRLESLDGRQGVLAHVDFRGGSRVGRYGVDVAGFETFLAGLDLEHAESPLLFIDEIGRMECLSSRFVALLRSLLDSEKIVVATVARKGLGFIAEVKKRADCAMEEVRLGEREELYDRLRERLAGRFRKM